MCWVAHCRYDHHCRAYAVIIGDMAIAEKVWPRLLEVRGDGIFGDSSAARGRWKKYRYSCYVIGKVNKARIFNFTGNQSWAVAMIPTLQLGSVGDI